MRKQLIGAAVGAIVLFGGGGFWLMGRWRSAAEQQRRLTYARQLIEVDRADEALQILYSKQLANDDEIVQERSSLQVDALAKTGEIGELRQKFYTSPEAFAENESAALLAARALAVSDDAAAFERLRETWRGRETKQAEWFAIEADALLRTGNVAKADSLLRGEKFEGANDVGRLIRLALLSSKQPEVAWQFLQRAYELDPRDANVRSFRGQILETLGRREQARVEYVAAYVADRDNAAMCDQLGEFYRRCGNFTGAQQTWAGIDAKHNTDFVELKRWFWSRAALPYGEKRSFPPGAWQPLVDFLHGLPDDRFWDADAYLHVSNHARVAAQRQEVYWLRLL
ncbi:MAG: hypothetical protein QF805_08345 [Pirellulaceae bacterium]|jgi:hypothetical protein|nr:hypothetical protein [Pirellulaceae bacterium]